MRNTLLALMGWTTRALAGAIVLTLLASMPAHATVRPKVPPKPRSVPVVTTTNVLVPQLPTDYEFRTVARLDSVPLQAGKQYRVAGEWSATSTIGSLMGARVEMVPVGSTDISERMRATLSTRNHEGTAGIRTVAGEGYFTVPGAPGEIVDYKVELRGQAGKCLIGADPANPTKCVTQPQYNLDLTAADLTLDPTARVGGLEWRQQQDVHFGQPPGRPAKVDVLWQQHTVPAGTQQVLAYLGTEISSESTGGNAPLRVRVTPYVRQLDAAGLYCKITKGTAEVVDVPSALHHYKFNQTVEATLDAACGTTDLSMKVYVEYLPATDGTVRHGGVVHGSAYSGGFVMPL